MPLVVVLCLLLGSLFLTAFYLLLGRIFGRSRSRILQSLPRFPHIFWHLLRSCFLLESPREFLAAYLSRRSISSRRLRFRDGLTVFLSSARDDSVTVFVVLIRHDYGSDPLQGVVVDIGANIGTFALDAARRGASRVLCFEPCLESIQHIEKNVAANGLSQVIFPYHYAVTGQGGDVVLFPVASDPSNSVDSPEEDGGECVAVKTISLADILTRYSLSRIDLLKLDCEGAEYPIIRDSPSWVWGHIQQIRMEYHQGDHADLRRRLEQLGFRTTHSHSTSTTVGHLWFVRAAAQAST